ncbi:uncharacterized protein BDR25DRAFT_306318 [Lindgomyces ingoldianus]|uniref:Uncharacterized protein n=1 Tax=Lindgomyces ingoldianus TaxID=673940 RepID=A0ACB6QGL6_9PLEO|nr:uncharacterized protein BDR25DRAFT_306318 [Lindgomyces ingoldianus]KAF2466129.1 hypothetical protein BDR25DRAFT_306318 [Lindgomyces ingoldianus]
MLAATTSTFGILSSLILDLSVFRILFSLVSALLSTDAFGILSGLVLCCSILSFFHIFNITTLYTSLP